MKLAVIGAGSTYTPELVSGLGRERDGLDLRELVLHDIDEERLEVVGALAQRMLERQGYTAGLQVTGELARTARGPSTSRTRSGSSPGRCSTPATGRSGCAT